MDMDRVLVLDAGSVVEFDAPYLLLQNENGVFTSMVKMTGRGMAINLKEMAKTAYDNRKNSSPYMQMHFNPFKSIMNDKPINGILIESSEHSDNENEYFKSTDL